MLCSIEELGLHGANMKIPQWALKSIQEVREKNLTTLSLRGDFYQTLDPLIEIPEDVFELTQLTTLDLGRNLLTNLPESIVKLKNLAFLYLGDNLFTSLPEPITKLTKLATLSIGFNKLSNLPESIIKLQSLRELELSNAQLVSLPEAVTKLRDLRWLNLGFNKLANLPESIGELQNLATLDVRDNKLTSLPDSIIKLHKLKELNLKGNQLATPPQEVAEKGVESIREYFRQLDEQGYDQLYEAKLLILGEPGAGKTTLAKKIENPNYELREEHSTEGVDVTTWSFLIEGNKVFRVNIWDFGGQEIYHATHQFFLTKRSLYALVADARKEDTDFYYWLNIVDLLSENSPVLIINNEKQDRHHDLNERQLRGQFKSLKDVLNINLSNNRGLDMVKEKIKEFIRDLPHIGSPLPKKWVQVRRRLETDQRNFISLEEYLTICKENGITESKDSLQLSNYLNDIGVFLHFQDEPLLEKIVILKPKWGTDAVYKVLDNKMVIKGLGRFTRTDLEVIWATPEYSTMRDELLQLMMKFKLCYEIPNQKGAYIAPQLLSENQPAHGWDETDNLLLRYTYEFMPKGILLRFIVAINRYIVGSFVWRSGVVITKDRTFAEIIEHYWKRQIHVRVTGKHKKELMTIIIHDLDQIHDSYKKLKYDKQIPCNCGDCKASAEPYFYKYDQLQNFIEKRIVEIQCGASGYMVNVRSLTDDIEGLKSEKEVEELMAKQKQSISGSIQVGDNFSGTIITGIVKNSFNKIESANISEELKDTLRQLIQAVESMKKSMSDEQVAETSEDLERLLDEAIKEAPRQKWYSVSIEGLIAAAENLDKLGKPVINLSQKVSSLLTAGLIK